MQSVNIIGVSKAGGFGNALADALDGYEVKRTHRGEAVALVDDIIVINLFDHSNPSLQETVFRSIFEQIKSEDRQLVVIGSTAHHFLETPYALAKRSLKDTFYELGKQTLEYKCKLLLVEPGALELIQGKPPKVSHMLYDELSTIIKQLLVLNPKFMHVAVRGDRTLL